MGGGGGSPDVSTPEYPDPSPTTIDETNKEVADAGRNARKAVSKSYNRQDTILSGTLAGEQNSSGKSSVLGG